jgi:hypothetical protein
MSPDSYPDALRKEKGKSTWYGEGPLWVDLAGFYDAAQVGDTVVARHAWWTVDAAGEATLETGPPTVTATRIDGPGEKVATVRRHADPPPSYWPTRLTFPDVSCWLVTGELDGTVVRVVVQAP